MRDSVKLPLSGCLLPVFSAEACSTVSLLWWWITQLRTSSQCDVVLIRLNESKGNSRYHLSKWEWGNYSCSSMPSAEDCTVNKYWEIQASSESLGMMACGKSTSQKRLTEPSLSRFGLGERWKDSLVNNHINLRRGKKINDCGLGLCSKGTVRYSSWQYELKKSEKQNHSNHEKNASLAQLRGCVTISTTWHLQLIFLEFSYPSVSNTFLEVLLELQRNVGH